MSECKQCGFNGELESQEGFCSFVCKANWLEAEVENWKKGSEFDETTISNLADKVVSQQEALSLCVEALESKCRNCITTVWKDGDCEKGCIYDKALSSIEAVKDIKAVLPEDGDDCNHKGSWRLSPDGVVCTKCGKENKQSNQ